MANRKQTQALAIREAAQRASLAMPGFAGRAIAALEKEAAAVHAAETEKRERGVRLVSTPQTFSALIRHGKTTFQFEGDSFAVTTHE